MLRHTLMILALAPAAAAACSSDEFAACNESRTCERIDSGSGADASAGTGPVTPGGAAGDAATAGASSSAGTAGATGGGAAGLYEGGAAAGADSGAGGAASGGSAGSAASGGAGGLSCSPLEQCGGQCVDTTTSSDHCGTCGHPCSLSGASDAACQSGFCAPTCVSPLSDCFTPDAPAPDDGCETNTSIDVDHCGACGTRCTNDNGTTACIGGTCVPACSGTFADCDSDPTDGCETDLDSSASHCGQCGRACTNAHGSTSCSGGICQPVCDAGFDSCNGDPDDGCEVDLLTDGDHCGRCGHSCLGGPCKDGYCQPVVVVAEANGQSLAVDDNYLYWSSWLVFRAPKTGGTPTVLYDAGTTDSLVVLDTKIYFQNRVGGTYGVWTMNLDGTVPYSIHTLSPQPTGIPPSSLSSYSGEIFFVNGQNQQVVALLGFPSPRTLSAGTTPSVVRRSCANLSSVYWTGNDGLFRVDRGASNGSAVMLDVRPADDVDCDTKNVYYTVARDIVSQPANGGSQTVHATISEYTEHLIATTVGVYFSSYGHAVYLQPAGATGAPVLLHQFIQGGVQDFAEDSEFVYFITNDAFSPLMKVAK